MRFSRLLSPLPLLLVLLLPSCGLFNSNTTTQTGRHGNPKGTGPFDRNGN